MDSSYRAPVVLQNKPQCDSTHNFDNISYISLLLAYEHGSTRSGMVVRRKTNKFVLPQLKQ